MGMTGASSAKRNAKRKAAKAYYDALKKAERGHEMERADTGAARTVRDELADDSSFQTRYQAGKADKLGRDMNRNRGAYNEKIQAYNERYDLLQEQFKGPFNKGHGTIPGSPDKVKEARAELDSLVKEERDFRQAQSKPRGLLAQRKAAAQGLTEDQNARAERIKVLRDKIDLYSKKPSLANSYRMLGGLTDAFNEMAVLSKEAQGYTGGRTGMQGGAQKNTNAAILDSVMKTTQPRARPVLRGGLLTQGNAPTSSMLPKPKEYLETVTAYNPQRMKLDENSIAYRTAQMGESYSALADRLRTLVSRDAGRAQMNRTGQQPVDMLGGDVIKPGADLASLELVS